MAQISKYPISKEIYERILSLLFKTTANLKTIKKVSDFFDEFLTPTEHIMLAKRLAIGILLAKNYSYREISGILKVSVATIGTVAIKYRYGKSFKKIVQQILDNEKMEDFWLGITEIISSAGKFGGKGSNAWRYLNSEIKKKRLSKSF